MKRIVLGTRGSDLALAQSRLVASALENAHAGLEVELRIVRTTGDVRLDVDLARPGALEKGLFTKELEEALLSKEIDFAVHSLKDLPVCIPQGLALGAITERADPSDALVSKHEGGIAGLPSGAVVATSSPRRTRQLLHLRPDLRVESIRGNVPTRIRKLEERPALDALLLAKAGLDRLGDIVPSGLTVTIEKDLLPAPGQGALGIECRENDAPVLEILAAIHHEQTALCVNAERALLLALGGGCSLPLGTLAELRNGEICLRSVLFSDAPAS